MLSGVLVLIVRFPRSLRGGVTGIWRRGEELGSGDAVGVVCDVDGRGTELGEEEEGCGAGDDGGNAGSAFALPVGEETAETKEDLPRGSLL